MRMICLVSHNSKSVVVYSLCKRFKDKTLIECEELTIGDKPYLNHYDINVSWRRFKKEIQKKGFTFPNLRNGY